MPQDLAAADGQAVLPAARVSVELPADQIKGGDLMTATVEMDLGGVPAGAYSGQLLFVADEGNLLALPLAVNVRHGPFAPALVLLLGVTLGLGLSAYRTRGKPRDELTLRIVVVRQAMEDDSDLAAGFGPRLNQALSEGEAAMREEKWNEAGTAITRAEVMLSKWRTARDAWVAQLTYLRDKLLPRLQGDAWTLRKLRQQVEDAQTGEADFENPTALRDRLFEVEKTLARFEALKNQLEGIGNTRAAALVDDTLKEGWRRSELALARRLQALLPGNESDWKQLETDLKTLSQEIVKATQGAKGLTRGEGEALVQRLTGALRPALPAGLFLPDAGPIPVSAGPPAHRRLRMFTLVTYALGGLVLAALGYSTLYLAKPTFGSAWVADYLSLLAWGLGAQVSVTSAAEFLQGLGISFGK